MTFLKSEFCGRQENYQKFYPMSFGGREIAKNKVSKVLVDTLYVSQSQLYFDYVKNKFGLLG